MDQGTGVDGAGRGASAHWPLDGNCEDAGGGGHHGRNAGADLACEGPVGRAAGFDGRHGAIEVAGGADLVGSLPFTLAARVCLDDPPRDVPGDIVTCYDPAGRRGVLLGIQTLAGVTSSQSNDRQLTFGVDNGSEPSSWLDCGRPGNAVYVCALAAHEDALYAGTFEMGAEECGHVYRYDGGSTWTDCGSPDPCNAVTALAVWQGDLYAEVSHYRSAGSSLEESPNLKPGGRIYCYGRGRTWVDCGKLGGPGTSAQKAEYSGYLTRFAGWRQAGGRGPGSWTRPRTCATVGPGRWPSTRAGSTAARCLQEGSTRWRRGGV